MMKIILVRHGEPDIDKVARLNSAEFSTWADKYDAVGLKSTALPTSDLIKLANEARYLVCSDLKRAIESAGKLGNKPVQQDSLFREVRFPDLHIPWLQMQARSWGMLKRLCWLSGYSTGIETFLCARQRAQKAAVHLIEYAQQYETILLMGHGFFNMLISRNLKKAGWIQSTHHGYDYWDYTIFHSTRV